jgi:hypothetical protein
MKDRTNGENHWGQVLHRNIRIIGVRCFIATFSSQIPTPPGTNCGRSRKNKSKAVMPGGGGAAMQGVPNFRAVPFLARESH